MSYLVRSSILAITVLAATPARAAPERTRPLATPTPAGRWLGPSADGVSARFRALADRPGRAVIHVEPRFGTVRIAEGARFSSRLEHTADSVLSWIAAERAAFALVNPRDELRVMDAIVRDRERGESYFRFHRVHRGLPVAGGERTVLLDRDGRVKRLTGHYPPSLALDLDVKVSAAAAQAAAAHFARKGDARDYVPQMVKLVILASDTPRLAHEVTLGYARPDREPWLARVYVDARDGSVLASRSLVFTAGTPATCTGMDWSQTQRSLQCTSFPMQSAPLLIDSTTLMTVSMDTRNGNNHTFNTAEELTAGSAAFAAPGNTVSSVNAVSAHHYINRAYDYFRNVHGRSSWSQVNGANLGQLSITDYGQSYNNAFATVIEVSGAQVSLSVFGNGDGVEFTDLTRCLDVAGHELTHNVVSATAGLVYQNQSGALNEHFADALGTAMDRRYEDNDDIMGENCTPGGNGIRNMADPTLHNQPAHMDDYRQLENTEEGDHGGVHINSGIPNKAFYNFYSTRDMATAERVWYRALTQGGLVAQSQFLDFTGAIRAACTDLALGQAVCADLDAALGAAGLHTSVGGGSCPPNSSPMGDACVCDQGWQPNSAGTACEQIATVMCPPHSTQYGEYCYCDEGWVPDAAGTGCVAENEAPCPQRSHRVGDRCVCDEGYYGDPNVPEGRCVPQLQQCGLFERWDGAAGRCDCLPGFVPVAGGGDCEPGTSGCGDETYFGRCLEGRYLVYCNDVTNPMNPLIEVLDCAGNGLACDLHPDDPSIGFDCVQYVDPCGDVPVEGRCAGNQLQICLGEGAERGAYAFDCEEYDAECHNIDGIVDCWFLEPEPEVPDAGTGGGPDGGTSTPDDPKDGACGCTEARGGPDASPAALLMLLLVAISRGARACARSRMRRP